MLKDPFVKRVEGIRRAMASSGCGAFVAVCHDGIGWEDIYYLTGFAGTSGVFLATVDDAMLFVDPRYSLLSARTGSCRSICCTAAGERSPVNAAAAFIKSVRPEKVAFGCRKISLESYRRVAKALGDGVELVDFSGVLLRVRRRKSDRELELIQKAVDIASSSFMSALERLAPGTTERGFAANLASLLYGAGGDFNAPPPLLVASGERTSFPHSWPTDRRMERGELIMVDFGVRFAGYVCDITRMIYLGNPPEDVRALYSMLRWAQAEAAAALRPGAPASGVDEAARSVVRSAGLGDFFVHGVGHGIGLDIHESPSIGPSSGMVLQEGDVVTLEPGFYRPGWGGMRVEDDYLVTSSGYRCLTEKLSNELFAV